MPEAWATYQVKPEQSNPDGEAPPQTYLEPRNLRALSTIWSPTAEEERIWAPATIEIGASTPGELGGAPSALIAATAGEGPLAVNRADFSKLGSELPPSLLAMFQT